MFILQRLHEKLYAINPTEIFVPSFIKAINEKTEDRFSNIISEPSPGILTFEIFQPEYCEMLVAEVSEALLFCCCLTILFVLSCCWSNSIQFLGKPFSNLDPENRHPNRASEQYEQHDVSWWFRNGIYASKSHG